MEVTDEHSDGNDDPAEALPGQHLTQIITGRHKADVCAGEEQHQTHIGVGKAHRNAAQRAAVHVQGHKLKNAEHHDDGQQRTDDLP